MAKLNNTRPLVGIGSLIRTVN